MDFSKWDKEVDEKEMEKAIDEARENNSREGLEAPKGLYMATIENMELGATKKDGRPMFRVQLRVTEAVDEPDNVAACEYLTHFKKKKPCLVMNRVIAGRKNDAGAIAGVITWLEKLEPEEPPKFKNYNQFAELIMDIFEEVSEAVELKVYYDPDKFQTILIKEVYDL